MSATIIKNHNIINPMLERRWIMSWCCRSYISVCLSWRIFTDAEPYSTMDWSTTETNMRNWLKTSELMLCNILFIDKIFNNRAANIYLRCCGSFFNSFPQHTLYVTYLERKLVEVTPLRPVSKALWITSVFSSLENIEINLPQFEIILIFPFFICSTINI